MEPTPSPPAAVLEAAGLRPEGLTLIPWGHRLWTAAVGGRPAVLHRYPAGRTAADVAWEHTFLRRLAPTGFPAPRPLGAFGGRSWLASVGVGYRVLGALGLLVALGGVPALAWQVGLAIRNAAALAAGP